MVDHVCCYDDEHATALRNFELLYMYSRIRPAATNNILVLHVIYTWRKMKGKWHKLQKETHGIVKPNLGTERKECEWHYLYVSLPNSTGACVGDGNYKASGRHPEIGHTTVLPPSGTGHRVPSMGPKGKPLTLGIIIKLHNMRGVWPWLLVSFSPLPPLPGSRAQDTDSCGFFCR